METVNVDGVPSGDPQNSFQSLGEAVGFSDSSTWFVATSGEDSIEVTFNDDGTADVLSNGDLFESIDLANGLKFYGPGSILDTIKFDGIPIELEVDNTKGVANFGVEYFGWTNVETGAEADRITVNRKIFSSLSTGAGDDEILWNVSERTDPDDIRFGGVHAGDGDDTLRYLHSVSLGFSDFDGGSGYDRIDYSALEEITHLMHTSFSTGVSSTLPNRPYYSPAVQNYEHVVGSSTGESRLDYAFFCGPLDCGVAQINFRPMTAEVNNNLVTLYDREYQLPLVFEGFDSIGMFIDRDYDTPSDLPLRTEIVSEIKVLSTDRDMELSADKIQLASNVDHTQGTTQGFVGNLQLRAEQLFVMSNMAGEATEGLVTSTVVGRRRYLHIEGMTKGSVFVAARNVVIHGSDSGNDEFIVKDTFLDAGPVDPLIAVSRNIYIQGHGGNDNFIFGSTLDEDNGDLDRLFDVVHVFAGEGRDRIYANDAGGDGNYSYLLNERWITNFPDPRGDVVRVFKGIYHTGVEAVQIKGTNQNNIFKTTPSESIQFNVNGAEGFDQFLLVGDVPESRSFIKRSGQGAGTWWFGAGESDKELILYEQMEKVAGVDRNAVATQSGSRATIRVFDSRTNRQLFDLKPYGAAFRGGVQVATGDLNGDAVPDIVVAPGKGRYALVLAFDGATGNRIGAFNAFPEPYRSGVDLAVGNVQSDYRNEIIVSNLSDGMNVKVFEVSNSSSLEFQAVQEFSPYIASAPKVGLRVATDDMNWDGVDDIITVPGPGWLPQVAVHDVSHGDHRQVSRFLAHTRNYRGGLSIAAGHFVGNRRPEIIVGAGITNSPRNPLSGQFRVFRGETIPQNAGDVVINPFYSVEAFSGAELVNVATADQDLDGRFDRIYAAPEDPTNVANRRVKSYRTDGVPALDETLVSDLELLQFGVDLWN